MTTYGGLEQVFEITLPEQPTLDESLPPWKNIDFNKPAEPKSFTEIFAQQNESEPDHDNPELSYSSPFTLSPLSSITSDHDEKLHRRSNSDSSFASEQSSLCSELAFESCDDVEDPIKNEEESNVRVYKISSSSSSRRNHDKKLPPPLPSIGRSGKPWGWLRSIRQNGRFTLTQMTIQSHEFMQARRENGRLKLQYFSVER